MRVVPSLTMLALTSFAVLTSALPYWSQQAVERSLSDSLAKRKVPYSVVPVDGGPSSSVPPETMTEETTKTITQPASTLPPTTRTIVSTIITTVSDVETTIIVTTTTGCSSCSSELPIFPTTPLVTSFEATTTSYSQAAVTNTLSVIDVSQIGDGQIQGTPSPTVSQISAPAVTQIDDGQIQATVVPGATSTSSYDDGMYHTTWSAWNSTAHAPTATTDPLPTLPTTTLAPAYPTEPAVEGYEADEPQPSATLLRRKEKNKKSSPTSDLPPLNLPKLPKTASEKVNPMEIPSIDFSNLHLVPGDYFDKRS